MKFELYVIFMYQYGPKQKTSLSSQVASRIWLMDYDLHILVPYNLCKYLFSSVIILLHNFT
jgi:hypothetical protein